MPTPKPPKVKPPKDEQERLARERAVKFVTDLCSALDGYAYNTRTYMPERIDSTDFSNALGKVRRFCEARPDWTLAILQTLRVVQEEPPKEGTCTMRLTARECVMLLQQVRPEGAPPKDKGEKAVLTRAMSKLQSQYERLTGERLYVDGEAAEEYMRFNDGGEEFPLTEAPVAFREDGEDQRNDLAGALGYDVKAYLGVPVWKQLLKEVRGLVSDRKDLNTLRRILVGAQ